jgi:arsenate reductase-like glutaredoxin family protein
VNAKKETFQLAKAKELLASANKLYAAKGKNVVEVDLKKASPTDEEIAKLMLGPTGNLRAPTIIKGKTVVVGFDHETYSKIFGLNQ